MIKSIALLVLVVAAAVIVVVAAVIVGVAMLSRRYLCTRGLAVLGFVCLVVLPPTL